MKADENARARSAEEIRALAAAESALAQEIGHKPVEIVSIEPAEWPDASLGWPEPGRSYAQVMTDGFRVTARSAGRLFECRVAGDNVRCRVIDGE